MNYRVKTPAPGPDELEAIIAAKLQRRASIMNGTEVQRIARTNSTTSEHIRGILKKEGWTLQTTSGGRLIWKR